MLDNKRLEIEKVIKKFITNKTKFYDINSDTMLYDEKIVNSLFTIELLIFIEQTYSIRFSSKDMDLRNFESINSIVDFIQEKLIK